MPRSLTPRPVPKGHAAPLAKPLAPAAIPPLVLGTQTALQNALKLALSFLTGSTLDPRITFTRNDATSCATYFDSTGRLVTQGANLVTNSNDSAGFPVVVTGQADPLGGTLAWSSTGNAADTSAGKSITPIAGQTYTGSVWLRVPSGTIASFNIYMNGGGSGIVQKVCTLTTTWQRFSVTATATTTASYALQIGGGSSWGVGTTIQVFGVQIENSATMNSYTQTTGTATSGPRFDYDPTVPAGTVGGELNLSAVDGSTPSNWQSSAIGTNAVAGKTYRVTGAATGFSGTSFAVKVGGVLVATQATSANFTLYFVAPASSSITLGANNSGTGYVTWAGISVQEVTFTPRGLLIEELRTNLLLQSNDFTQAYWAKQNSAITAGLVGPMGAATATRLADGTTVNAVHQLYVNTGVTLTAAANTFSVFAKAGEYSYINLSIDGTTNCFFNLTTGAVGTNTGTTNPTITPVGSGWYRCSITSTTTASTFFSSVKLSPDGVNTTYAPADLTKGVYIFGAQIELGAFPTSYIPTTTATVTRAADSASMTGTNFSSWWNPTAGTLVAEFDSATPAFISGASVVSADAGTTGGSASTGIWFSNPTSLILESANSPAGTNITLTASGNSAKAAYAFAANDRAGTINGAAVSSSATGGVAASANQLTLGRSRTSGQGTYLSGHIRSIRFYNTRLTNAQLQALTA